MGSLTGKYGTVEPIEGYQDNVLSVTQDSIYRTSLQPSIWRKEYLLSKLKIGMTPWDFELVFPKNDGVKILTTKENHPLMFSHLFRKGGKPQKDWFVSVKFENSRLPEKETEIIRKMLKLP